MTGPPAAGWYRRDGERVLLELYVQPGTRRTGVAGLHGERLKVRVAARAVDGSANQCLREFLAAALGATLRDVTIEAGEHSRSKRVAVRGALRGAEALLPPD